MHALELAMKASDLWAQLLFDASTHEFETLTQTIVVADDQGRFVRPLAPAHQELSS
jgi:hypothetical protein